MLSTIHQGLIISGFIAPCLLGIGLTANAQIGSESNLWAQSNSTDTLNPPEIKSPSTGPTNPHPTGPIDPGPGLPGPTNPSPGIINDVYPPDPNHPSNPDHVDSPVREKLPEVNRPNKPVPDRIPTPNNSPK